MLFNCLFIPCRRIIRLPSEAYEVLRPLYPCRTGSVIVCEANYPGNQPSTACQEGGPVVLKREVITLTAVLVRCSSVLNWYSGHTEAAYIVLALTRFTV